MLSLIVRIEEEMHKKSDAHHYKSNIGDLGDDWKKTFQPWET